LNGNVTERTTHLKNSWFCTSVLTFLLITLSSLPGDSVFAVTYTLTVDGSVRQGPVPHFWSECVGTGTMEYCLKPAWRNAARIGVSQAGFKRVRGHGILIHGNSTDNIKLGSAPDWDFSVIDQIYDTVIACGLKPIVELSFMPKSLQSNGTNAPPNSYANWKNLIASLVTHLEKRYGAAEVRKWYFEVWNEYDYSGFWSGTAAQYYTLYDSAAAAVRSVDTNILIGGPASTTSVPLQDFWNNCNARGIKFLSNHQYGVGSDNIALPTNIRDDNRARSDVIKSIGRNILSFNTEYSTSYSCQGGNPIASCYAVDNHKGAPFVAKSIKLIISDCIDGKNRYPDVLSYWALSDCFDEWWGNTNNSYIEGNNNVPFGQVFGLINYQGIRKATFNAFAMLHKMGDFGLQMTGGSADADGVDGFATVNADSSQVALLIYSYYNDLTTIGSDNSASVIINKLPFENGRQLTINHYRVDSLHSNPYAIWQRFNKPVSPSAVLWDSIRAHQNLETMEPQSTIQYTGAPISRTFAMPRWSISLLTITGGTTGTERASGARLENTLFSVHGTVLTVSSRLRGPVIAMVYGPNGRLLKKIRAQKRSVDLGAGLGKGMYLTLAKIDGTLFMKKIAVY
jgi:xylan 1,4-beta-xylosidase